MEAKLREYVESLFRNAPDTPRNREIKEEILQNTLDRFHDDAAGGMDAERAYQRAVGSVGDVESLLEGVKAPKAKNRRNGWTIFAIIAAILVLLAVILTLNYAGKDRREKETYAPEATNDRVETSVGGIFESIGEIVDSALDGDITVNGASFNYTYDDAEDYTVGNLSLTGEKVEEIELHWMVGEVYVETYDGDELTIEETAPAGNDALRLRWLLRDGKLTIQPCGAGKHEKMPEKSLKVRLPREMGENLRSFTLETASASVTIWDVKAERIRLESASGDIQWSNGIWKDPERNSRICEKLEWSSASGSLYYSGAVRSAELETASGDCSLFCQETVKQVSFTSASGDLFLGLPERQGFRAKMDTASGELFTDVEVTYLNDTWIYGGSARFDPAELSFDTASGNVEIK